MNDKARKILFDTYWTSAGWRERPHKTEAHDLAFAISAGYMFEPRTLSHDEVVTWLLKAREVEMRSVSDAFLASLSSRRLEWRSALGSYAFARHFPKHKTVGKMCEVCGQTFVLQSKYRVDLNVLNFERFKWGGVRHLDTVYAAFDLELFGSTEVEPFSAEDVAILRRILEIAGDIGATARPGDLARQLRGLFPSNEDERRILIQILGICGILQPRERPGFFRSFANSRDCEGPPHHKSDWNYPISWWRGCDGVDAEAVDFYFPQLNS